MASGEDTGDQLAIGYDGQRASELVVKLEVGRYAQAMVNGRDDLGRGDGVEIRACSDLIAAAMDMAGPDAASGQEERIAVVPVIAPALGIDLGAAPNSPMTTTNVRSNVPRATRSSSRLEMAASSCGSRVFLSVGKLFACVSHVALASGAHEMLATRTPASTSRRARSTLCP